MKAILSTDIGTDIDDALAMYLCIKNQDNISLDAVITTNGDVETRARIAKKIADLADYKVPILVGEADPISKEVSPYMTDMEQNYITEEDKKKELAELGIVEKGLEYIAKIIDDEMIILSTGPLTNIAKLIQNGVIKKNKIYIIGGRENLPSH